MVSSWWVLSWSLRSFLKGAPSFFTTLPCCTGRLVSHLPRSTTDLLNSGYLTGVKNCPSNLALAAIATSFEPPRVSIGKQSSAKSIISAWLVHSNQRIMHWGEWADEEHALYALYNKNLQAPLPIICPVAWPVVSPMAPARPELALASSSKFKFVC